MIGGKINLGQLKNVVREMNGKDGKKIKAIIIPIEENNLFEKDGNVFLDIIAFDSPNSKYGDTHMVKQSLPKEKREEMSEEEKRAMPILGNLNANLGGGTQAPQQSENVSLDANDMENLPF